MNRSKCLFYLFRQDGIAVITPTDEDIALEITVTNRHGDDAHQSHVIITLPDTLRYSSVVHRGKEVSSRFSLSLEKQWQTSNKSILSNESQIRKNKERCSTCLHEMLLVSTQLSCSANENGTLIDCELGNPFHRDAEVRQIENNSQSLYRSNH